MRNIKNKMIYLLSAFIFLSAMTTADIAAQCVDCAGGPVATSGTAAFAPDWTIVNTNVQGGQYISFSVIKDKVYRWSTLGEEDFNEDIYPVPAPCNLDTHCGGSDPMYVCNMASFTCELAFDTQLTLLNGTCGSVKKCGGNGDPCLDNSNCDTVVGEQCLETNVLAYNRNAVFRNQSQIEWKATFDGTVYLYLTKHDCAASALHTTVKWQMIDSSWCDECEYYSPRPYNDGESFVLHYENPVNAPGWSPVGNDPDRYPDPVNPGTIRLCNAAHPTLGVYGKEFGYCFDYDQNVKGGDYQTYHVEEGNIYRWSTCGDPIYDTQLTLFRGADCGTDFLAYSDDDSSCAVTNLQSTIIWQADTTGVVTLLVNRYNCAVCQEIMHPFDPYFDCPKTTLRWQRHDCGECSVLYSSPAAPSSTPVLITGLVHGEYFQLNLIAGTEYMFEGTTSDIGSTFKPVITLRKGSGCLVPVIKQGEKVIWKPFQNETVTVLVSARNCDAVFASGKTAGISYSIAYDPSTRFEYDPRIPAVTGDVQAGVAKDTLTGVYYKDTSSFGNTWATAMGECGFLTTSNPITWVEDGDNLFINWRLPNINELTSIIDYDLYDKATSLNLPSYFSGADGDQNCTVNNQTVTCNSPAYPSNICGNDGKCVRNNWYWSNTTVFNAPQSAWVANMEDGRTYRGLKDKFDDGDITQNATDFKVLCVGAISRKVACDPSTPPANSEWSAKNHDGFITQEKIDGVWTPLPTECTWDCYPGYVADETGCWAEDGATRVVSCVDNKPANAVWAHPNSYGTITQTYDEIAVQWLPSNTSCAWECDYGFSLVGGLCVIGECGNGVVDDGETCDMNKADNFWGSGWITCNTFATAAGFDPSLVYFGDSTYAICESDCSGYDVSGCHYCGDTVKEPWEECDWGLSPDLNCAYGPTPCEVCSPQCELVPGILSYCGDGDIDTANGEECDHGGTVNLDCDYDSPSCQVCNSLCKLQAGNISSCGDGVTNGPEECDDGTANNTWTNRCNPDCKWNRCGPANGWPLDYNTSSAWKWGYNPATDNCYVYWNFAINFDQAQANCSWLGSLSGRATNLANIGSTAENDWVKTNIAPAHTNYWIGYKRHFPGSGSPTSSQHTCTTFYTADPNGGYYTGVTPSGSLNALRCGGSDGGKRHYFRFVPSESGVWRIRANVLNEANIILQIRNDSCTFNSVTGGCAERTDKGAVEITPNLTAGTAYKVAVANYSYNYYNLQYELWMTPPSGGTWRWTDGNNHGHTDWAGGQPDNSGGVENCAHVWGSASNTSLWNDNQCSANMPFVCESGGIGERTTVKHVSSCLALPANATWSPNTGTGKWVLYNSAVGQWDPALENNPNIGGECRFFCNEGYRWDGHSCVLTTCPSGWRANINGTCLKLVSTNRTWEAARNHCRDVELGWLGTISNESERLVFKKFVDTTWSSSSYTFVGFSDQESMVPGASESNWRWLGEPDNTYGRCDGCAQPDGIWPRPPWSSGEPNNSANCGLIYASGLLDDSPCGTGRWHICERNGW